MSVQVETIDHGWNRIRKELKKLNGGYTAIGFFGHGGDPSDDLAARAAVQELGATIKVTKKMRFYFLYKFGFMLKKAVIVIPKRSFMKQTFDKNKNKINKQLDLAYDQVLKGSFGTKQMLARIGEWWIGLTKLTIRSGSFKPNSGFTISQKGSTRPLVDDGEMINGVEHKEFFK
jgi:hypothetical protein